MQRVVNLLVLLLVPFVWTQSCNTDSFAVGKNGQTFLKITNSGGLALGVNAALSQYDTVSVNGSIRLSGSGPRPPCTGPTRGMIWLENGVTGVADQLFICTKIVNAGTETFVWRNVFLGVTAGRVNGPELKDPWGFTWDGFNRRANSWSEANAQCLSIGARLPSVTELFRNNQASGTSAISDYTSVSSYLWTLIPGAAAGTWVQVRLYDGAITISAGSSSGYYRCVWPLTPEGNEFTSSNCYGPPGSECITVGNFFNFDRQLRPALTWVSAVEECKFFGGSLPTIPELQVAFTTTGFPIASTNVWANNIALSLGVGSNYIAGITWRSPPDNFWGYSSFGTYLSTASAYQFACIGKRPELPGFLPTNAPCNGDCFTLTGTKSRILADSANRNATNFGQAADNCRSIGATIPSFSQVTDLIHGGWQNASSTYLWMSEYYWYTGITYGLFQWGSLTPERWVPNSGTTSEALSTSSYEYRCIWVETFESTPTTCQPTEATVLKNNALSCVPTTRGNANGKSFPNTDFPDIWGYAWDLQQRAAATFDAARNTCLSNGGRLPYPGEIWRVRATNYPNNIGDNTATSYLWTIAPSYTPDTYTTIRVSDGVVSYSASSTATPFRCVWPPVPQGDVFGSRACFGDPANPCFTAGRMRIDRLDRAAVSWPTAVYECNALGGSLPTMQQYNSLLSAGIVNGTGNWLWTNHASYVYSASPSGTVIRWTGTASNTTITSTTQYRSYAATTGSYSYRCLWDDEYFL